MSNTPAVTFAREALSPDLVTELTPLLVRHYTEIAQFQDIPFDPDWPVYTEMAYAGVLRVFTVRADGVLIGYAVFIIRHHPHYRSSLQANQDILFVDPVWRRATLGLQLVDFCDEALRAEGCQIVYQHVKRAHPALGYIAEQAGYHPIETIYAKRLDVGVDHGVSGADRTVVTRRLPVDGKSA